MPKGCPIFVDLSKHLGNLDKLTNTTKECQADKVTSMFACSHKKCLGLKAQFKR